MKNKTILWVLVAIVIAVGGVLIFQSYTTPEDYDDGVTEVNDKEYVDEEISETPDVGITADDILENPDLYEGDEVIVRAEVEEWLSPRAFTLDAPGIVNDQLLVITSEPTYVFEDAELFGDDIWQVEGTVDQFIYATTIPDMDLDFDSETVAVYEGKPFIQADSVELFED